MINFPKSHVVMACVVALPLTSLLLASSRTGPEEGGPGSEVVLAELAPLALPEPGISLSEDPEKPLPQGSPQGSPEGSMPAQADAELLPMSLATT